MDRKSDRRRDGRGTRLNPENRYEKVHIEPDEIEDDGARRLPTLYLRDRSRSILARNESPDVGFRYSVNPYRGCEHGCIYCYARPSHEHLGFSAGLDFETRIMVKVDAPELLREELSSPRWEPQVVALSGNTDCYQPIERRLALTRRCLEVFAELGNPVSVITKSALVIRDLDLLVRLARRRAAHVYVSLTTLDPELAGRMEPRAASPARRLQALRALADAGVPAGVMVAPVIPGLTDEEIPSILTAAREAGARAAGWQLVRLTRPVDELFAAWLERNYPERSKRVLARVRDCRGGRLTDSRFGIRHRGEGAYAAQIAALFQVTARRLGLDRPLPPLSVESFTRPGPRQLELFV